VTGQNGQCQRQGFFGLRLIVINELEIVAKNYPLTPIYPIHRSNYQYRKLQPICPFWITTLYPNATLSNST